MKRLVIDTATGNLQISLWDNAIMWSEVYPKGRGEVLGTWLPAQLEKYDVSLSELDSVLVGIGPGSFTGLRTGIAFAQGLCANGRKLYTASTLGLLASYQDLVGETLIAMRARPGLWYLGHYEHHKSSLLKIREWMGDLSGLPLVQNYIIDQSFLDEFDSMDEHAHFIQWDHHNWMAKSWDPSPWFVEEHRHASESIGVRPNYIQVPSAEVVLKRKKLDRGDT